MFCRMLYSLVLISLFLFVSQASAQILRFEDVARASVAFPALEPFVVGLLALVMTGPGWVTLRVPRCFSLVVLVCMCLCSQNAFAEGSTQLGPHVLGQQTILEVDVLSTAETFVWTGTGFVSLTDPNGSSMGTFASGTTITPSIAGTYRVVLTSDQSLSWDLAVFSGPSPVTGRVHALEWHLNSGSYGEASSADYDLYALTPAGGPSDQIVYQIRVDGLAGFGYDVRANRTGVDGIRAGTSMPIPDSSAPAEIPLYLDVPEVASFSSIPPQLSSFQVTAAGGYNFDFATNVEGAYHIVLDVDGDGIFDVSGVDDVMLSGLTVPGANSVYWDGRDRFGFELALGSYDVRIFVSVGECHLIMNGAETLYQGLRIFEVLGDLSRIGVAMYWNDSEIQANAVVMPNGQPGLENSGPSGVSSGSPVDEAVANSNTHAWGDFNLSGLGKGGDARLDTWARSEDASSSAMLVYTGAGPAPGVPFLTPWALGLFLASLVGGGCRALR